MMFNKELFYSLCAKYDAELSQTVAEPMLRDKDGMHAVSDKDINHIFSLCQSYFDYFDSETIVRKCMNTYEVCEDFAIAC